MINVLDLFVILKIRSIEFRTQIYSTDRSKRSTTTAFYSLHPKTISNGKIFHAPYNKQTTCLLLQNGYDVQQKVMSPYLSSNFIIFPDVQGYIIYCYRNGAAIYHRTFNLLQYKFRAFKKEYMAQINLLLAINWQYDRTENGCKLDTVNLYQSYFTSSIISFKTRIPLNFLKPSARLLLTD